MPFKSFQTSNVKENHCFKSCLISWGSWYFFKCFDVVFRDVGYTAQFKIDSWLVFMNFYCNKKYQLVFYEICDYRIQKNIVFAQKSVWLAVWFVFGMKSINSVSATMFKGCHAGRIPKYHIKIFKKIFWATQNQLEIQKAKFTLQEAGYVFDLT